MGAWVATRWLVVRDLRLLRVLAVLRDGGGHMIPLRICASRRCWEEANSRGYVSKYQKSQSLSD
jgi:hypothetical protein